MAEEQVFEGKDLEEALECAASALGVPEADLHYEIVEQGRKGVLGLGAKNVQIRIMPPVGEPQPVKKKPAPRAVPSDVASDVASDTPAKQVEETVRHMLELMGLDVEVSSTFADGGVNLRFKGPDRKMLMAKNAELLSALQFLLNRMSRRAWPGVGRIYLGGNGQRRKRDTELVELVREVAQQVSRTAKTKKLQPMNAYERRLVHLTVREFPGLTSSSDGEGPIKRVRISKVQNAI